MSEEIFSLIKADCTYEDLQGFLTQLPIEEENLHLLLNRRNVDRYTPLHCAIFARNLDAVKVLIKHGADVDLKCHGTPNLHLALSSATLPGAKNFGLECFHLLVKHDADCSAKDDQLATVLHLAAEYDFVDVITSLLENPSLAIDLECKDRGGNRPLHRTAWRDSASAARVLVNKGSVVDAQTAYGTTPLHLSATNAAVKTWEVLVAAGVAADGKTDSWGRTPAQLAKVHGWISSKNGLKPDLSRLQPSNMLEFPTSIITHKYCRQHYTCPPSETGADVPPENIKRLHVIIDSKDGVLKGSDLANRLVWNEECRMAAMSDVLRVHEWSYIRRIQGHCEQIRSDPEGYGGMSNLDGDTTISRLTFEAALRGAGAVCQGVDDIMTGKSRNAFAPVRPPGHHAGPRGLTKGEDGGPDSHGFCFLNNISIGAAYAMNKYRETVKRVAIVDFDVHHGNGTEETVRWLKPGLDQEEFFGDSTFGSVNVPRYKPWYGEDDAQNVMFVSIHGYGPRERGLESMFPQGAFYPGSGKTKIPAVDRLRPKAAGSSASVWDTVGKRKETNAVETVNLSSLKQETADADSDEQDSTAIQMQGGSDDDSADNDDDEEEEEDGDYEEGQMDMQGGDGEDGSDSDATQPNPEHKYTSHKLRAMRKLYTNMDAYSATKKDREALVLDVGVNLPASNEVTSSEYRHMWRNYFRQEIFPSLMAFKPDMIFISAGFDAHKKDTINSGYIALVEEDFDWVTQGLVRVANSCCEGRVVSALEGGYQIGGELCSSFAKSVKTHVAALVTGARTAAPWSPDDAETERAVEKMHLDEAAERRLQKELARQVQEAARRAAALAARAEAEAEAAALEGYNEDSHDAVPSGAQGVGAWSALHVQGTGTERDQHITSLPDDEDPVDGSARKRRRARAQVDYVALDLALQAQKEAAALALV